jgi:FG-GAP repeat protein
MKFNHVSNTLLAIIPMFLVLSLISCSVGDSQAPAQITDLSVDEVSRNLNWTAPGDSGNTGRATIYFPRFYDNTEVAEILGVPNLDGVPFSEIEEAVQDNFAGATQVPDFEQPEPAGNPESFLTPRVDLTGELTFFYAIVTNDEVGDSSKPSNVTQLTTPLQSVRYVSGEAETCLGEAVAAGNLSGDLNDRGISINDIVVGDPCAGIVYIFFGDNDLTDDGSTLIDVSAADVAVIGSADDGFGSSLATLPDFTGDTRADELVIGAPDFDGGRGKIFVIFGSRELPSVIDLSDPEVGRIEVVGENVGDGFGFEVSDADDVVDGGGLFLVGAPFFDGDTGRVYIYRGARLDENTELPATEDEANFTGQAAGGLFGFDIALVGRINRNSNDEFGVGAPGLSRAYIIFGSSSLDSLDLAVDTTGVVVLEVDGVPSFGTSISGDGDIDEDGEGRPDVIVGAPEADSDTGAVFLYSGDELLTAFEDGTTTTFETEFTGISPGDRFGNSVSVLDGFTPILEKKKKDTAIVLELEVSNADIAAGAPGTDPGTVYIFFGQEDLPAEVSAADSDINVVGEPGDTEFAQEVMTTGDVNGDEISDFAVGGEGFIQIVY